MNILDVFEYNQHFVAMMNIINNARLNQPTEGHKHHIIPRCWFKLNNIPTDNSKDNLVLLTVEDHLKVHMLSILCAATPEMKSKMGFAVKRLMGGTFSGMKHTKDTIELIKAKRALQVITNVNKSKISETLKGKSKPTRTEEHCKALSKSLKGHKWDEEVIKQRGISNRHPKSSKLNYKKSWKTLSELFHKYKDEGGELKWQDWLSKRKEVNNV